jgi:hypothetical protein
MPGSKKIGQQPKKYFHLSNGVLTKMKTQFLFLLKASMLKVLQGVD